MELCEQCNTKIINHMYKNNNIPFPPGYVIPFKHKNNNFEILVVNTFKNITQANNKFIYCIREHTKNKNEREKTYTLTIPEGDYEIAQLNKTIQMLMKNNGHDSAIMIFPLLDTFHSRIIITKPDYDVIFSNERGTFHKLLGFNEGRKAGHFAGIVYNSENTINILGC
jgi:hypothetical protein